MNFPDFDPSTRRSFFQSLSKLFPQQPSELAFSEIDTNNDSIPNIIDKFIENLPAPEPLHMLDYMQKTCEMQEQKVYSKICQYRSMDIYEEMNKVSSELYDLKNMNSEELNLKLSEAVEKMKRFDERMALSSSMEFEEENLQVKLEENNDETKSNSKFYQNILQSSNYISERDENEDPVESQEKKDVYKQEDFCFSNLGLPRKNKKFPMDFNYIHNFLDENENVGFSPHHHLHNELNILKEIDMNEGISNSRYYE